MPWEPTKDDLFFILKTFTRLKKMAEAQGRELDVRLNASLIQKAEILTLRYYEIAKAIQEHLQEVQELDDLERALEKRKL